MNNLTVVSRYKDNSLAQSESFKKSRLKYKEKIKIINAVNEHTYLLSNNRTAMDSEGVKNSLGWDNEGTIGFINSLNDTQKMSSECGKVLVYSSTVCAEAAHRTEQPFDIKKKEKSKLGRELIYNVLENRLNNQADKDV
jgi:hypothetical protein